MIGTIRMLLRFAWLTLLILGVRRVMQIMQEGADELIDRVEHGEDAGFARTLARLHEALHHRQARETTGASALGEM